jgi:hypothetical protein
MIMKTASRRRGIATTPSTQLEVRKSSETDTESLTLAGFSYFFANLSVGDPEPSGKP